MPGLTEEQGRLVGGALIAASVKLGKPSEEFVVWLCGMVGEFRAMNALQDGLPRSATPSAKELEKAIAGVLAVMDAMPPALSTRLTADSVEYGYEPVDVVSIRADLTGLQFALLRVIDRAYFEPPQYRGRPKSTTRDDLMNQVALKLIDLGVARGDARPVASEVLEAADVAAPCDGRSRSRKSREK